MRIAVRAIATRALSSKRAWVAGDAGGAPDGSAKSVTKRPAM